MEWLGRGSWRLGGVSIRLCFDVALERFLFCKIPGVLSVNEILRLQGDGWCALLLRTC